MSNVKGKGQRLIPEELLKYLEAFKENHPDPTQGGGATLDDIVDSQGNKRFVEGDITLDISDSDISTYGFETIYGKWSLSGTHLMVVACFSVTSSWTPSKTIYKIDLPKYIYDKIYALGSGGLISRPTGIDYQGTNKNFIVYKRNDTIELYSSVQFNPGGAIRVQFDLLIDAS